MHTVVSLTTSALIEPVLRHRDSPPVDYDLATVDRDDLPVERADLLIGDWTHERPIDADMLGRAHRCRAVVQPTAGHDRVDIEAARELGIPVVNVPGANADSVAEWVVMAALMLLKRPGELDAKLREGHWLMADAPRLGVGELAGRSIGIVGFGRIGRGVAHRLRAFGVGRIRYFDLIDAPPEVEAELGAVRCDLPVVLAESQVVTLHLPLSPQTRQLLDGDHLGHLRKDAILVNTSRAGVVDEEMLQARLHAGELQGAAIDVFGTEPLPPDDAWHDTPRTLLSPHVAGSTTEACTRMLDRALAAVDDVLAHDIIKHSVNGIDHPRQV